MVQCVSKIKTSPQTGDGLLQRWSILRRERGVAQQMVHHLQHLIHSKAVVAAQHPLQFQRHRFG